jgi:hypothetical protein
MYVSNDARARRIKEVVEVPVYIEKEIVVEVIKEV